MNETLLILSICINIVVLVLYGIDKFRAVCKAWRIPERVLLVAAIFGPFGAYLAMRLFRHKIRNTRFSILVPLFIVLHVVLYLLLSMDSGNMPG
ncbi:MAG: DUF1294 domain-containing protein [Methanospirillum sp.]|nr:DUF1294 domain-containing protein [Methanospirillum sp.]